MDNILVFKIDPSGIEKPHDIFFEGMQIIEPKTMNFDLILVAFETK